MKKTVHVSMLIILLMMFFITILPMTTTANNVSENKLVYVIPIEFEVERGLEAFLKRATKEAVEIGANHIIFEIDTPGGFVDAAGDISRLLNELEIPTTSFIVNKALSAGSYLALHTDNIYMRPNATMGASGIIDGEGNAADKKAQSYWVAAMKTAAEMNGRDPIYAIAMADDQIDLPELNAPKGEYLTLTATNAYEVGYSEGTVQNRTELLYELNLVNAQIVEVEPTLAEKVARFITNPVVIPILFSIASLGLILELYTPGFGIPGIMGLSALLLFFYGHLIAGLAGMETLLLFVVGIILIVVEFFITSGIFGTIGAISIVVSLFLAGSDFKHMSISIAIAIVLAIIAGIVLFKRIGAEKGIFRKLILRDRTTTELGYISNAGRKELIGVECVTITPLRPSGAVIYENERIDVVSEGSFIEKDKKVIITAVEGIRVVVREVNV